MPVNYQPLTAEQIFQIPNISLNSVVAEIRKKDRKDLTLISLPENSVVVGVFTKNKFCAAPVKICQQHLISSQNNIRALIINTGIANAGTGEIGYNAAKEVCKNLAKTLNINENQVLPFSTGVILEHLPYEKIINNLVELSQNLSNSANAWFNAANAIMTTDTVPKIYSKQVKINANLTITLNGMAKGSGMIHPNMATMLSFLAVDIAIPAKVLQQIVSDVANKSFNCITVDGDTSTNDSFILISVPNKNSNISAENLSSDEISILKNAILIAATELSKAIIRDAEGASKFITINVYNGADENECKKVGFSVAHSPLVKTAFFASDPNLGRILAAIGYAEVANLEVNKIKVYLNDLLVAENGGRATTYSEPEAVKIMQNTDIEINIDLARGDAKSTIYTSDLSHDYVGINADYRS